MRTKQQLIFLCKVSEQAKRYEEMLPNIMSAVQLGGQLSEEERNLLQVAYKNSVMPRRTSWRAINQIEKKEEAKSSKNIHLLYDIKKKIENELDNICRSIIDLLEKNLLIKASTPEAQIFYLKMKGDYYRYISQYTTGQQKQQAIEISGQAYKKGEESQDMLKHTNYIRLGLSLNHSVYHYEVMKNPQKAYQIAKEAFYSAIGNINQIDQERFKDSMTAMQHIRDNLILWMLQLEKDVEQEK